MCVCVCRYDRRKEREREWRLEELERKGVKKSKFTRDKDRLVADCGSSCGDGGVGAELVLEVVVVCGTTTLTTRAGTSASELLWAWLLQR